MAVDTQRDILYRGFLLNDSAIRDSIEAGAGIGKGIDGSVVDSWDTSDIDIVQFMEKRALQDGMDAGDVFHGGRRLKIAGTHYGSTRALLYDRLDEFMAATNAVLAQRDTPLDKGFEQLFFAKPTNRQDDYPDGGIALFVRARPGPRQFIIQRDQQGGSDAQALAVPYQASFVMRDPVMYGTDLIDVSLGTGGINVAGNFTNRGNYISRLNMLISVGTASGSVAVTAGGVTFSISVPASTGARLIRYKGEDKVLTIEENSVEVTRMDKLILPASGNHPIIPPGTSPYTVTSTGITAATGSHMWFYEAYS